MISHNIALRWKLAFCLALMAGVLTMAVGLINEARFLTVLIRSVISASVFSLGGYFTGIVIENFLRTLLNDDQKKGKNIDIFAEADESESSALEPQFSPLTPDHLERVFRPND